MVSMVTTASTTVVVTVLTTLRVTKRLDIVIRDVNLDIPMFSVAKVNTVKSYQC